MNIERLPIKYRRPHEISPTEMWGSPDPSDLMVWEVCPYTKGIDIGVDDGCQRCSAYEEDAHHGKVKRGCRMWAEEACRMMMAVQRREAASQSEEGE